MFTPHTLDPDLYPAGTQIESGGSAVSWASILAGATTAMATWFVLFTLGAGLGLAESSSWQAAQPTTTFRIAVGVWLIITQWVSFAMGGYIAGRLRVRWTSLHTDEVFFRDTAHGLLTWAIATVIVAGLGVLVTAMTSSGAMSGSDMGTGMTGPDMSANVTEALRKAAAATAIFTAIAMLTGAFIASVSAVIGGRLRDRHP